jgi:membrane-bound lytic murein transglycosylase B
MYSVSFRRLTPVITITAILIAVGTPDVLAQSGAEAPSPMRKPLNVPPGTIMATPIPNPKPQSESAPSFRPTSKPASKPAAEVSGGLGSGFDKWLADFKVEAAAKHGFSEDFLNSVFTNARFVERVIELDKRQPESTLTHKTYLERVVSERRIREGRANFAANRKALLAVEQKYGVPAEIITALWGIETSYGAITGGFRVLDSLSSIAYEGRRRSFFQAELVNLLTIIQQEDRSPDDFLGSWAGAMGQSQFMPSSFLAYAVDGDGDGKRDIWGTKADVFASAANYLKQSGWNADQRWGRAVTVPAGLDRGLLDGKTVKSLGDWQLAGIRLDSGADLPPAGADFMARLIQPDGAGGPAFLVYDNYDVILRWNRSNYFATAVGILSEKIAEAR